MSDKKSEPGQHESRVRDMFARIAGRYDLLNHLLSGNMDKRWRRRVARSLKQTLAAPGVAVLDVACGTGDLAITLFESSGARVIGTDFCRPMLVRAAKKASQRADPIPFIEGDALHLPFQTGTFDAVTIAFGLRNLSSVEGGLGELLRVLKPGGTVVVLEFSQPVLPLFRAVFRFYFTNILPRLGGIVSGTRSAYEYLPDSVSKFPDQRRLASMMRETGFAEVEYQNLTGGIAALHSGRKARTEHTS